MTQFEELFLIPVTENIEKKIARLESRYESFEPVAHVKDLKRGDYVVHLKYGIGRFLGTKNLQVHGKTIKHLAIEYANREILYLGLHEPVERYIGGEGHGPKLTKLHTKEWERIKEKTRIAIHSVAKDMLETMYAHDGIGIAAPQVGKNIQLCIANPTQTRGKELVLLNPTLVNGQGSVSFVEGCLSVPHVWGKIKRWAKVRLKAQDLRGQSVEIDAEGLLAVVLQHECEHLQGKLFIDRLSWLERRRLAPQLAKLR